MGLLAWIIFGGLAGWVASRLAGARHGCCLYIIVGIVGAFIGGALMETLTGVGFGMGFNLPSFAVAVMGAVILLAVARLFAGRQRP
jgi:uncharacterized membrane protein YeaQ/YmgE (transglycosylase-associated protein family)